jgi:hypothetical protein
MKGKPKAGVHHREPQTDDDLREGYPSYPETEDIYGRFKKAKDVNPEEPSKTRRMEKYEEKEPKYYADDLTGEDLDVPGSELDDDDEWSGDEDEENNYYSLGGDNHNDLEEDNDY